MNIRFNLLTSYVILAPKIRTFKNGTTNQSPVNKKKLRQLL